MYFVQMPRVFREPRGHPLILTRLRHRRWRIDAEDLGTHVWILERAVQVCSEHARASNALGGAILEPCERGNIDARVERRDTEMNLVGAEPHTVRRRRRRGLRPLLERELGDRGDQAKPVRMSR